MSALLATLKPHLALKKKGISYPLITRCFLVSILQCFALLQTFPIVLRAQSLSSEDLEELAKNPEKMALLTDTWRNIPGDVVSEVEANRGRPDHSSYLKEDGRRFQFESEMYGDYFRECNGWFLAPETGVYRFQAVASHSARMWIELKGTRQLILDLPKSTPENDWSQTKEQKSKPVDLEEGQAYRITVQYKAGDGRNFFGLGVTFPSGWSERPIRVNRFVPAPKGMSFHLDADNDGLSSYQEWVLGTDPEQRSTAGDGISDLDKAVMDLDPLVPLKTPPALSFSWCKKHGIPLEPDAKWQDPDRDDLQNQEEYRLGYDPKNPDTSGDGIPDGVAARIFRLKPGQTLNREHLIPVASMKGSASLSTRGFWKTGYGGISQQTLSSNGSATYRVLNAKAEPLVVILQVEASHERNRSIEEIWISMNVKGQEIGRQPLHLRPRTPVDAWYLLPSAETAIQDITFQIENLDENLNVTFRSLNIYRLPSTDEGRQVLNQWKDATLTVPDAPSSLISPFCLEGGSILPDSLSILDSTGESFPDTEVHPLPNEGWYANVPLPEAGTPLNFTVQHRASGVTRKLELKWSPTNLWNEPPGYLRVGDALRITAHPPNRVEGMFSLNINGLDYKPQDVRQPIVQRFTEPGIYEMTCDWMLDESRRSFTRSIEVVEKKSFETYLLTAPNDQVKWPRETDPGKHVVWDQRVEIKTSENSYWPTGSRTGHYVRALRAGPEGPVLGSKPLEFFRAALRPKTWSDSHLDGSETRYARVTLSRVPDSLHIHITPRAPWLSLQDGTRSQWFDSRDFDGSGRLIFMFHAPSKGSKPWTPYNITYKRSGPK